MPCPSLAIVTSLDWHKSYSILKVSRMSESPFSIRPPESWHFPSAEESAVALGLNKTLEEEAHELGRVLYRRRHKGDESCGVCFETAKGRSMEVTPCGHFFHTKCLVPWKNVKMRDTCPSCRGDMFPHGRFLYGQVGREWEEEIVAEALAQLSVRFAEPLSLPAPPFSFAEPDESHNYPIIYNIETWNGVNTRLLAALCTWVQVMGVRISQVDEVARNAGTVTMVRRPGGMEILVRSIGRHVNIHAVAVAAPQREAGLWDILCPLYPFVSGVPLAAVDMLDRPESSRDALAAQAACLLLACGPGHEDGLNFGDPAEAVTLFPETVALNSAVTFDTDQFLEALNDTLLSNINIEDETEEDGEDGEDYSGEDSP